MNKYIGKRDKRNNETMNECVKMKDNGNKNLRRGRKKEKEE